jgi:Na+/phosphate symporter
MMKLVALLVCIIGLLIYALCDSGKLVEVGHVMFAFGLLAVLLHGLPQWGSGAKLL